MRILIVGAGPAGLTLAYWLHRNGHTPIVIEKAPDIRTQGYMIDFTGTGYDIATRMGVIDELRQVSHPVKQILYKNARGETAATLPIEKLYSALHISDHYLALDHRDLVDTLYHAVEQGVEFHFGKTVKAICQSEDHVTATFSDDTEETFDLLVGADGIHSKVRDLVFGDERQFANYLGYYVVTFYAPAVDPDLDYGYLMYLEPNIQLGIFPQSRERWLCYFIYKSEDVGRIPADQQAATLREHVRGVGWIAQKIIDALLADTPIFVDTVTQIEMPKWSSNRVVLIGDAAYCLTLISGQGASMAMAGAYFLADALQKSEAQTEAQAFTQYENRLRTYIEATQAKARRFAPNFVPGSRRGIMLTEWLVRLIDFPPVTWIVSKQLNVASIIKDTDTVSA